VAQGPGQFRVCPFRAEPVRVTGIDPGSSVLESQHISGVKNVRRTEVEPVAIPRFYRVRHSDMAFRGSPFLSSDRIMIRRAFGDD